MCPCRSLTASKLHAHKTPFRTVNIQISLSEIETIDNYVLFLKQNTQGADAVIGYIIFFKDNRYEGFDVISYNLRPNILLKSRLINALRAFAKKKFHHVIAVCSFALPRDRYHLTVWQRNDPYAFVCNDRAVRDMKAVLQRDNQKKCVKQAQTVPMLALTLQMHPHQNGNVAESFADAATRGFEETSVRTNDCLSQNIS